MPRYKHVSRSSLYELYHHCTKKVTWDHVRLLHENFHANEVHKLMSCGGFGVARIINQKDGFFQVSDNHDGIRAFLFPVLADDADYLGLSIYDIWAMPVDSPEYKYRLTGNSNFLGADVHRMTVFDPDHETIKVYPTVPDWIAGGFDGLVPWSLEKEIRPLLAFDRLEASSETFAVTLAEAIRNEAMKNTPVIDYPL